MRELPAVPAVQWIIVGLVAAVFLCAAPLRAQDARRKVITICGNRIELMTGAEVRARGFPWVDVPDDQNAATYYIKGANALHALKTSGDWDAQRKYAIKFGWDNAMEELAKELDASRPALDHYRKGASKKLCQLPYGRTRMLAGMLLPSLAKARRAARLLAVDARRFEAEGQFKRAVDNYLTILKIGCHYGSARTLIDHLVGTACAGIGADAAFRGVCRRNYPARDLERLASGLAALRGRLPSFARAMESEKAFGLGTMDGLMRIGPNAMGAVMNFGGGAMTDLAPLEARLLRILLPDRTVKKDLGGFYERSIAAAKKPYYSAEARKDFTTDCKPWNIFAHLLLPALSRARVAAEKCRAQVEMLGLAVALKMYQRQFGVYPDRLNWLVQEKLVKELPPDPFSGKSFKYRTKEGDFTLYSVGENMKDDGGKLRSAVDFQGADYGFTSKLRRPVPYRRPRKP